MNESERTKGEKDDERRHLDELEKKGLFKRTFLREFESIAEKIKRWCPRTAEMPMDQFLAECKESPEFRQIVFETSKWFPPVYPRYAGGSPVNRESQIHEKLIVEYFAECFQREMALVYDRPRIQRQYDAVSDAEKEYNYEAWICLLLDKSVSQVAFFREDAPIKLAEEHGTKWVLKWVWTSPSSRGKGTMSKGWPMFEEKYGPFFICQPLSDGAKRIIEKNKVSSHRLLSEET